MLHRPIAPPRAVFLLYESETERWASQSAWEPTTDREGRLALHAVPYLASSKQTGSTPTAAAMYWWHGSRHPTPPYLTSSPHQNRNICPKFVTSDESTKLFSGGSGLNSSNDRIARMLLVSIWSDRYENARSGVMADGIPSLLSCRLGVGWTTPSPNSSCACAKSPTTEATPVQCSSNVDWVAYDCRFVGEHQSLLFL